MKKWWLAILMFSSCTASKTIVDASASYDPDGWIVRQEIEQISGTKAVVNETSKLIYEIALPEKGVYVFRITLTDNDSAKTSKVIQEVK